MRKGKGTVLSVVRLVRYGRGQRIDGDGFRVPVGGVTKASLKAST